MAKQLLALAGCLGVSALAFGGTGEPATGDFGALWRNQEAVVKMEFRAG